MCVLPIVSTITNVDLPCGTVLSADPGLWLWPVGVWIGMFADWGVRSVIYSVRFLRGRWATKRVLRS